MPYFAQNELVLVRNDKQKGIKFRLGSAVAFYLDDVRYVVVEEDQDTDLASIPKLLWWWFPPTGQYDKAAIVHDYLYRGGVVRIEGTDDVYRPTRAEADEIFLAALKALGIKFSKRRAMYLSVRVFGHKHYQK